MSRIYIAASTADIERARSVAARLYAAGHHILSTWHARPLATLPGQDHTLSAAARHDLAEANHRDLEAADTFVLLWSPACRGALVEAGVAVGSDHFVSCVAVGDPQAATLMLATGFGWVADDAALVAWLAPAAVLAAVAPTVTP
jgi:hypothetical protein